MRLTQIIEALLFASDAPLTAEDLARVDERLDEETVTAVIDELRREYDETDRSFQVFEVAGGFQLLTRPEFAVVLEQWETVPQTTRLSQPALEVLSIIAYRQPLGRAEVEEIRGVQSAAVLRTLQDRHLIDAVGRAEGLGRPLLYGTTTKFLEHFGFRSLEDLPRPDDLPVVLRAPVREEATEESSPAETPEDTAAAGTAPEAEAVATGARPDGADAPDAEPTGDDVPDPLAESIRGESNGAAPQEDGEASRTDGAADTTEADESGTEEDERSPAAVREE